MEEIYFPSHDGVTTIHACIWKPEGEVKGVVQIIHGMRSEEHTSELQSH